MKSLFYETFVKCMQMAESILIIVSDINSNSRGYYYLYKKDVTFTVNSKASNRFFTDSKQSIIVPFIHGHL